MASPISAGFRAPRSYKPYYIPSDHSIRDSILSKLMYANIRVQLASFRPDCRSHYRSSISYTHGDHLLKRWNISQTRVF